MSSSKPNNSLYPEVLTSNPEAVAASASASPSSSSSSSSLYPRVDRVNDMADSLFPEPDTILRAPPSQELLIKIPGVILHLIEPSNSVELACGELNIVALRQDDNVVAVLARIGDDIQWPLAKDEPVVKLDETHYFFTLHVPAINSGVQEDDGEDQEHGKEKERVLDDVVVVSSHEGFEVLNYGLTVAAKGQEGLLMELDKILESYSCFSVQSVKEMENWEMVAKAVSPEEMERSEKTKDLVAENSAAYWTTLAPNVEDYSGKVARLIAAGSGQLIRGILWCGDLTVDRLKWGHDFLKRRMGPGLESEISPACMKRMQRVKKMTKMSENMASGILSGVVKVSGFFTSSIVNSAVGRKFFSLLPGEIVLASLDGFNKVCDAVEVAGRNVMSTTSTVTTGLVSQRYGEKAARATTEGLDAAGHAIGTAWAVFKIRKALNPKSVLKPTTLVKAAAEANSEGLKSKSNKNGS